MSDIAPLPVLLIGAVGLAILGLAILRMAVLEVRQVRQPPQVHRPGTAEPADHTRAA